MTLDQLRRLYGPALTAATVAERLHVSQQKAARILAGELVQCEARRSARWGGAQCERWTALYDPVAGGFRCPRHEVRETATDRQAA